MIPVDTDLLQYPLVVELGQLLAGCSDAGCEGGKSLSGESAMPASISDGARQLTAGSESSGDSGADKGSCVSVSEGGSAVAETGVPSGWIQSSHPSGAGGQLGSGLQP